MRRRLLTIAALLLAPVSNAAAEELVALLRKDGLVVRGALDARTDEHSIWLQRQRGGVAVSFSTAWDDVISGEWDGRALPMTKLRKVAIRRRPTRTLSYLDLPATDQHRERAPSPRVFATHLVLDAQTANWDADVVRDGVQVRLAIMDERDDPIQAKGVLRATLWGVRKAAANRPAKWTRIGSWSQFVKAEAFHNGEAKIRLPYQGAAPERQTGWSRHAILHAQFQPQRGRLLEASRTIRLRNDDYLRDQLETSRGQRSLPFESTRQTAFAR